MRLAQRILAVATAALSLTVGALAQPAQPAAPANPWANKLFLADIANNASAGIASQLLPEGLLVHDPCENGVLLRSM